MVVTGAQAEVVEDHSPHVESPRAAIRAEAAPAKARVASMEYMKGWSKSSQVGRVEENDRMVKPEDSILMLEMTGRLEKMLET